MYLLNGTMLQSYSLSFDSFLLHIFNLKIYVKFVYAAIFHKAISKMPELEIKIYNNDNKTILITSILI